MRAALPRFFGSRSGVVWLALAALAAIPACHRQGADKSREKAKATASDVAQVKKSFDDLRTRLTVLEGQFAELRKKIDSIPPELPNFPETRERFFATEEGRGVMNAKLTLLLGRLDAVMASQKAEDVRQLSQELTTTSSSVSQLEQLQVTLLHQVMALQRMAEKRQEAQAAAGKSATGKAAGKHQRKNPTSPHEAR